jgi:hypothetical protein
LRSFAVGELSILRGPLRPERTQRLAGLAFLCVLTGCGGSGSTLPPEDAGSVEARGLERLGEMYRLVRVELGRPPRNLIELHQAEAKVPGGLSEVGEENLVVCFGVELPDTTGPPGAVPSDKVLAYIRSVPRSGGYVLMLDRTVRTMTPQEFKMAQLAGRPTPLATD